MGAKHLMAGIVARMDGEDQMLRPYGRKEEKGAKHSKNGNALPVREREERGEGQGQAIARTAAGGEG